MYGWSREETLGRTIDDLGLLTVTPEIYAGWMDSLNTRGTIKNLEVTYRKKTGELGTALNSSEIIELGGKPHILSITLDISERKRSEEEIKEGEERLRAILEANPDPTVVYDAEGRTTYLNPAFTKIFGWTWEDLRGRRIPFVPENQVGISTAKIKELYAEGGPVKFETKRLTKDGRIIDVVVSSAGIKNPAGQTVGMVVNITDVTEKKLLESQLRHSQKMEALGTFTGGIAHDFNNILQAISGFSQLILIAHGLSGKIRSHAVEIHNAAHRGADLVKRLLTFSREVEPRLKPMDLNKAVSQSVLMLERIIPKMISIETDLGKNLKPVNGDPAHLEQIILNLGINARDAMPEGGRITIETRSYSATRHEDQGPPLLEEGNYTVLKFSDTGQGIDKETLDRIFEPFFTTKKFGQGTGMGLSSVYGIVQSHQGHITCHSQPGEGAVFRIYFPEISQAVPVPDQPRQADRAVTGGAETILLIDDEEPIRSLAEEMLVRQGYKVVTTPDGEGGIEVYSRMKGEIDLVILDLVMPGMGGQKTLEKLIEINPEIRVIIASGYSTPPEMKKVMASGAADFIAKPYRLNNLLTLVRETLDRKAG